MLSNSDALLCSALEHISRKKSVALGSIFHLSRLSAFCAHMHGVVLSSTMLVSMSVVTRWALDCRRGMNGTLYLVYELVPADCCVREELRSSDAYAFVFQKVLP